MLYFLYKIAKCLFLKFPLSVCYGMAIVCADIYNFFAQGDRKNLEYNLKIVLKTDDKKLIEQYIKNIFRNFTKYLVDFFRFAKLSRNYLLNQVSIEGKENIDKTLSKGKGAILLSAHIGNWELGAAVVASLGYPLHVIALDHKDKRINDFFLKQRSLADVNVIPIGAQLKNCFRVLRENNLLAIVGDRDFSARGVMENFFGRPTILPKGPAVFSLKTGAPIIPCFLLRMKNDTFKFAIEKPIESRRTGSEEVDTRHIMQQYTAVIEKYIKSYPDQWYAFRKMW